MSEIQFKIQLYIGTSNRVFRVLAGEDMVPEPSGEGEASAGGRDREAEAVCASTAPPEFRLEPNVLGCRSTRGSRKRVALHSRRGHGQALARRCGSGHVHDATWRT